DVHPDDGDQHDEATGQAVQEELHRGPGPVPSTPVPADHEVDRDQHGFEEDVEQEDVGGREDTDHHGLQDQDEREVPGPAVGTVVVLTPGGEHHERDQDRRHQDQDQGDAVDTDGV